MADLKKRPQEKDSLRTRLHKAIPGGAHTYSRGDDQFPEIAPPLLAKGKGAFVWDNEGNRYLDYGMALRSVTLGYADSRVNQRAIEEMEKGVNLTRPSFTELEAAEKLIELIPSIEMVKFAKNGSNVTTAALKIARAYTGKKYVCVPRQQPFFSFDDWFIGTTPLKRGIPDAATKSTLIFDYGDISSLEALFEQYPDQIAAVIMEPATNQMPCSRIRLENGDWYEYGGEGCPDQSENFLKQVETICRNNETLFVLDEMITGFRWGLAGAQTLFGVRPDLTTFGKGMANGYSVAAIGGRREVMEVGGILQQGMERTFLLSTTHGAEMTGLGAFLETVKIYEEENVVDHLWNYGAQLKQLINGCARDAGLGDYICTDGPDISLNYLTKDHNGEMSLAFRTLLSQELLKAGVMMPWIAVSQSHDEDALSITEDAFRKALKVYGNALEEGVEQYLVGEAIKPVFRRYN